MDKQALYELLLTIPRGKVVTYGTLAEMLGNRRMARVVGNALHSNPDGEKYPCYKVVRTAKASPAAHTPSAVSMNKSAVLKQTAS